MYVLMSFCNPAFLAAKSNKAYYLNNKLLCSTETAKQGLNYSEVPDPKIYIKKLSRIYIKLRLLECKK